MVEIVSRVPTVGEFRSLAESVGWGDHFEWETLKSALDGSLHCVVALENGTVVGSGRLVGDGTRYFYVQDVIVHPDASNDGLATQIVGRLLAWVRLHASTSAVVGLFASPEAVGIYTTMGFTSAVSDPLGMTLRIGS
jgi:GNAT superfamily N-acetyltransferase